MIIETNTIFFCLYTLDESNSLKGVYTAAIPLDTDIVRKCKDGDRKAFNELIRLYQKKIFNIMYRFCGSYEDAKDLTQDVFVKIFRSLKSLKEESKFSSWVIAVAANTYKNEYKYLKSRGKGKLDSLDCPVKTQDGEITSDLKDETLSADEQVHKRKIQEVVQSKIDLLKHDYKEVIILRDMEGLEYEEIASTLNISIGTVKSRIFRAREELKGYLANVIEQL